MIFCYLYILVHWSSSSPILSSQPYFTHASTFIVIVLTFAFKWTLKSVLLPLLLQRYQRHSCSFDALLTLSLTCYTKSMRNFVAKHEIRNLNCSRERAHKHNHLILNYFTSVIYLIYIPTGAIWCHGIISVIKVVMR